MDQRYRETYKYKLDLPDLKSNPEFHEPTKIHCPSCQHEVEVKNLDLADKVGKCENCNSVFEFRSQIQQLLEPLADQSEHYHKPESIYQYENPDELEISMGQPLQDYEIVLGALLPFFSLLMVLIYFVKGMLFSVFLISVVIGLLALLDLLTLRWQRLFIHLNRAELSIQWKPKKFNKNVILDAREIDQVYLKPRMSKFDLYAITKSYHGVKHHQLIPGIAGISKAKYLEQEIERFLHLEDRRVPEESEGTT